MFFKPKGTPKKRNPIVNLFRIFLSLVMIFILSIGLYLAFRNFSGFDPLNLNPSLSVRNILTSDKFYNFISGVLSVNPKISLKRLEDIFNGQKSGNDGQVLTDQPSAAPSAPLLYKFAIVSDSHNDNANLAKALTMSKEAGVDFVIGLGDFSDVGTIDELRNTKSQFDSANLPYYLSPGDHDLWDSRDKLNNPTANFSLVFGTPYTSLYHKNTHLILLYNSDNYEGLDGIQLDWLKDNLKSPPDSDINLTFLFVSIPLFHPSSDHIMGKTEPKLKKQAEEIINLAKENNVAEVIAGDTHFSSAYIEPRTSLKMTVVGALTSTRNLQSPRFTIVDVYENGSYNIQDIEIK